MVETRKGRILPMSLNIKNERVHALAREAARVLGTTQTGAIEVALTRLLDAEGVDLAAADLERRRRRVADLLTKIDAHRAELEAQGIVMPDSQTAFDELYDEHGLPR